MMPEFDTTPLGRSTTGDWLARAEGADGIDQRLHPCFLASDAATGHLERLVAGEALCVTTGQQPGLLTGPLFTIYKALSAIALARRYQAELERPVVPVFWVAGDDHDFAEANHAWLINRANDAQRLELRSRDAGAPTTPLYRELLGNDIVKLFAEVDQATPDTEFRATVVDWLWRHYRPETDFATAFAEALADLLGPHGLIVFQPTKRPAKAVMARWLVAALERAGEIAEAVGARSQGLEQAGHPVPVTVHADHTLVMIEGREGRDRLMFEGDVFATRRSGERWSLDELLAIAGEEPERLSPNVLLRPVVEAALLPTLTYVAGPGELAYLPQAAPVYEVLGVLPQAAAPRWSCRVIDARVRKTLDKYGIMPDELGGAEGQLEGRLVRDSMPDGAAAALTAVRRTINQETPKLVDAAVRIDPTLKKRVGAARQRALGAFTEIEKRIVSHLKQQDEIVMRQVASARHVLFPDGQPQERILNITHFLVRYGREFVDAALHACEVWVGNLEGVARRA